MFVLHKIYFIFFFLISGSLTAMGLGDSALTPGNGAMQPASTPTATTARKLAPRSSVANSTMHDRLAFWGTIGAIAGILGGSAAWLWKRHTQASLNLDPDGFQDLKRKRQITENSSETAFCMDAETNGKQVVMHGRNSRWLTLAEIRTQYEQRLKELSEKPSGDAARS